MVEVSPRAVHLARAHALLSRCRCSSERSTRPMNHSKTPRAILFADDDPDDRMLVRDALEESRLDCDLRCVEDGEELIDYLRRRGKYVSAQAAPRPALILLDLNMPRKDG